MVRALALVVAAYPAVVFAQPCPRPAHEWPADGNGKDVIGGIDATVPAGVTFAPGHTGQAFSFDGRGSFVQAPFIYAGPFTIELWVNPATAGQARFASALSTGYPAHYFPHFQIDFDGLGNWLVDAGRAEVVAIGPARPGTWQHITVVSDGLKTLTTYLDGAFAASSSAWESNLVPVQFEVLKFGINRDQNYPFQGLIDDVRFFDKALTSLQVSSFHDGVCAAPPPEARCVGTAAAPVVIQTAPGTCGAVVGAGNAGSCANGTCTFDGLASKTFAPGVHAVVVTATSPSGATARCTSWVDVIDAEPPHAGAAERPLHRQLRLHRVLRLRFVRAGTAQRGLHGHRHQRQRRDLHHHGHRGRYHSARPHPAPPAGAAVQPTRRRRGPHPDRRRGPLRDRRLRRRHRRAAGWRDHPCGAAGSSRRRRLRRLPPRRDRVPGKERGRRSSRRCRHLPRLLLGA
jgi:hypothetical protein